MPASRTSAGPDYALEERLHLTTREQLQALSHPLRNRLLALLDQRAATISQLAAALDCLKGSVGHHLRVLEAAALVRVVRTRTVRGGTERYYGRTARAFELPAEADRVPPDLLLRLAGGEMAPRPPDAPDLVRLQHVRLSRDQVEAFAARLVAISEELPPPGTPGKPVYALLLGLFRTDLPSLPEDPAQGPAG